MLGPDHAPLSSGMAPLACRIRARGYLPEALVNYLALLGWSPGEGEELAADEMARRFDDSRQSQRRRVRHREARMDEPALHEAGRAIAPGALVQPWFVAAGMVQDGTAGALESVESVLSMAVGAVDRLEEVPERVSFVFAWDSSTAARLVAAEPDSARIVGAFRGGDRECHGPLTKRPSELPRRGRGR